MRRMLALSETAMIDLHFRKAQNSDADDDQIKEVPFDCSDIEEAQCKDINL